MTAMNKNAPNGMKTKLFKAAFIVSKTIIKIRLDIQLVNEQIAVPALLDS